MEDHFDKIENRFADDAIYGNEDRYETPKEHFKFISDLIPFDQFSKFNVLDVGCSNGEFLYFLRSRYPNSKLMGCDVSKSLVLRANSAVTGLDAKVVSLSDSCKMKELGRFELVNCSGVLSIFDDPSLPIRNLLNCVAPGGVLFLSTLVNDDPVDVLMRYKSSIDSSENYQSGWNVFSRNTIDRILGEVAVVSSVEWHDFLMPFAIKKGDDPMRTWTIKTEANSFQTVNGASQLTNMKVALIKTKA